MSLITNIRNTLSVSKTVQFSSSIFLLKWSEIRFCWIPLSGSTVSAPAPGLSWYEWDIYRIDMTPQCPSRQSHNPPKQRCTHTHTHTLSVFFNAWCWLLMARSISLCVRWAHWGKSRPQETAREATGFCVCVPSTQVAGTIPCLTVLLNTKSLSSLHGIWPETRLGVNRGRWMRNKWMKIMGKGKIEYTSTGITEKRV